MTVAAARPPFALSYVTIIEPVPLTMYSITRVVRPGCPLRTRMRDGCF
jgi:hypothetical protein